MYTDYFRNDLSLCKKSPVGTIEYGSLFVEPEAMSHTYTNILIHYVFSTKNRRRLITPEIEERLYPFMAAIARDNGMAPVMAGGTADHVHLLVTVSSTLSVSKGVQLIKGGSSKFVNETFPGPERFQWQSGYGAFSVSISHREDTIRYIQNQEAHHRKMTFQEEFIAILKKHGLEYDERYVWD